MKTTAESFPYGGIEKMDVFNQIPDWPQIVCGPCSKESDFVQNEKE
jgi:hypothetical protein